MQRKYFLPLRGTQIKDLQRTQLQEDVPLWLCKYMYQHCTFRQQEGQALQEVDRYTIDYTFTVIKNFVFFIYQFLAKFRFAQ